MSRRGDDSIQVAVVGDRAAAFPPHDSIDESVRHASAVLGAPPVSVTWFATPDLRDSADDALNGFDAVWCAPGSPYVSLEGALEGIRVARERRIPFLGTCAGFQHGVLEIARNVIGQGDAAHREYGETNDPQRYFIDELLCSLAGLTMRVDVVDPVVREMYGEVDVEEEYYCSFGLDEARRDELAAAGLLVAGSDPTDGGTRIMRLEHHPFFLLTLFVPQTRSRPGSPHPLIRGFVAAAARAKATP